MIIPIIVFLIASAGIAGEPAASDDKKKGVKVTESKPDRTTNVSATIDGMAPESAEDLNFLEGLGGTVDEANKKFASGDLPQKELNKVLEKAKSKGDEITAKNPQNSLVQTSGSRLAMRLGDYKTGLERAERAVSLAQAQKDPQALRLGLVARAMNQFHSGNYEKAHADAEEVIKLDPEGPFGRTASIISKLSRGRTSRPTSQEEPMGADVAAAQGQAAHAPLTSSDGNLGAWGLRATNHIEALKLLQASMNQIKVGDPRGSLRTLQQALELDPTIPHIYMQRGIAEMALKRLESAIDELGKAISLWVSLGGGGQSLVAAHNIRSRLLVDLKRHREAFDDAERAVRLDPESAQGYFNRAQAQVGLRGKAEAILADFKRAAELDPRQFAADYEDVLAAYNKQGRIERHAGTSEAESRQSRILIYAAAGAILAGLGVAGWLTRGRKQRTVGFGRREEGRVVGGHFQISKLLGSGGMGKVYEAWDMNLERTVAVKRLNEDLGEDLAELERFLAEAKTVAALKHPNIVAVHEAFQEDKDIYIVFERVEGETLHQMIKREGKLKPADCLPLVKPICEALDHAHARGIIHRDLKPGNIMIENGTVKVMDFGIARRTQNADKHTKTSMIIGTPLYMAPELQFGDVSRESDFYALGVCLYEMLCGRLPFDGPYTQQEKLEGRFSPAGRSELDGFFRRALDPRRENRFHSGAELWGAFLKAVS